MEKEGKERKEKPGVILSSKKKNGDEVKSDHFFGRACCRGMWTDCEAVCVQTDTQKQR